MTGRLQYYRDYYRTHRDEALAKAKLRYKQNKDRHATAGRAYRLKNRERIAARRRGYTLNKYSISVGEYRQLFDRQGGVCAICGKPETKAIKGSVCHLSVDHDHQTGRLRGLLCRACNLVLGYASDNPQVLRRAAKYIEAL